MTTQHTPGPWKADRNYGPEWNGLGWHIMDENNDFIATLFCWPEPRQAANARLMAAAPAMLEALERLARLGNGEHYGNSDGNMIARAAIAKAKGE